MGTANPKKMPSRLFPGCEQRCFYTYFTLPRFTLCLTLNSSRFWLLYIYRHVTNANDVYCLVASSHIFDQRSG